jgi:L-cystine uptake protein TcyP (sodium:dicarboxylate symporter family)
MPHDEAIAQLQASLDLALARPGCMGVVSPHVLAVVLAHLQKENEGEPIDATG